MTKKHFIALADCMCKVKANLPSQGYDNALEDWQTTCEALADFCATQNPRFNRQLWLDYIAGECGPNGGKR